MAAKHCILELRTGRDSDHTPETAVQLFATIPHLKNNFIYRLLGQDEKLSFEIIVQNQTIYFLLYVPQRLSNYLKASLTASYPEILINELSADPIDYFIYHLNNPPSPDKKKFWQIASLDLFNQEYLPLKSFLDFKDIDPLATVLSTLATVDADDQIYLQFIVSQDWNLWKKLGYSKISQIKTHDPLETLSDQLKQSSSHPQKSLIEKKLKSESLKVAIKIAVQSNNSATSHILIESIASAYQAISQSEGNYLSLNKKYLIKRFCLQKMKERSFLMAKNIHLSLEELATLYHLPNKALSVIPNIAWGKNLLGEPPEKLPIVTRDSNSQLKQEINVYAETTYKNSLIKYGIKKADRRRHIYVIGKTGTGKSTLLANMVINDLKKDEGICVIDPHGDLVETVLNYIPSRRINDVIYFNPADSERTVQINLFEGESIVHRELIASGIVYIFHKLYEYSWGPRLEYILRNALLTLLKNKQSRLSDVLELLTNQKFRNRIVDTLDDKILKSFWLNEFDQMQIRLRTEAIAPILNKVGQFVTSPLVRNVVNTKTSSFSIEEAMNHGKIILANLSQGKLGEDNATLLGAMLITKIQLAAMARVNVSEKNRRDFYLYVDEFQNFATQAFSKILSEARKYRLNLVLANQYIAQIPEDVQKAIFGNCGTMIGFVMGADDAGAFEKEFSGKYTQEDLVTLGRYQIVNKLCIDGLVSLPFPAQTLPLAKSINQNRDKVIKVSRERYAKNQTQ